MTTTGKPVESLVSLVVGVDVGGTFTDLFVLDEASGTARIVKVPSTRGEEARGFMNGEARALLAEGCEAVCLFFINTYANAENERLAVAVVREIWPNAHVTSASEVLPEIREFERCSTATLNAALQPVVGGYLARLESDL